MTRFGRIGLILAVAAVAPGCGWFQPAGELDLARLENEFQNALDALRKEYGFHGAVAAYALPDGSVTALATGYADAAHSKTMPPDARMLAGSVGKTFTAAVALSLAREGVLNLDVPVARYFDTDGEDAWLLRLPNATTVTTRNLLTHTSGLIDYVEDIAFTEDARRHLLENGPDWVCTPRELLEYAMDKPPLFDAGGGFHYSDTNYILAGLAIERSSGRAYYDLLDERFLSPLNLSSTSPSDSRALPGLVGGHLETENLLYLPEEILTDGRLAVHPATEWTGGGLVSTAADLARWAKALYEENAMDGAYLEELFESGYRGPDRDNTYGLGVFIYNTTIGEAYGHSGWFPGYNTNLIYFPKQHVAVCIQVNRDYGNDLSLFVERLSQVVINALPA